MAKNKLARFEENKTFDCLVQPPQKEVAEGSFEWKGKWNNWFDNNNPLAAELGCGRGEYTIGLARRFPDKNFLGIDIKGARLWFGAVEVENENIPNAGFIRTRIDFTDKLFGKDELDEIWITFPDPQPQKPRERKRLTSPRFLNRYLQVLKPGGIIHLKTDNIHFFEYTLEVIMENKLVLHQEIRDLHHNDAIAEKFPWLKDITTHYEGIFIEQQIPIHYLSFSLTGERLDESKSRAFPEVTYRSRSR